MRFLGTMILIIMFIAVFGVGQALYQSDIKENETTNIYNKTEEVFVWNSSTFETAKINLTNKLNESELQLLLFNNRVRNVLYKGMDFLGFSMFEVSKWGIEFGYNHPEYDFIWATKQLPKLIKIIIILVVVSLLLRAALPLFAIFYLTGLGIYTLIKKYHKPRGGKSNV